MKLITMCKPCFQDSSNMYILLQQLSSFLSLAAWLAMKEKKLEFFLNSSISLKNKL